MSMTRVSDLVGVGYSITRILGVRWEWTIGGGRRTRKPSGESGPIVTGGGGEGVRETLRDGEGTTSKVSVSDHVVEPVTSPPSDQLHEPITTANLEVSTPVSSQSQVQKEEVVEEVTSSPQQGNLETKVERKKKVMVEASLPTTRWGRLYQYTSLAASLGFGTASEVFKRSVGLSQSQVGESALWNEANVNRIVSRLSRMRGAAQKLGQVLSIQDANVLPPQIEKILFEIQHSGTFMPNRQLLTVLRTELGEDWESQLLEFDPTPFAAASIGQVHWAKVLNDQSVPEEVAVKVQYPGVANAIDSDLDSLKLLLVASRLLPRGLYLEKTIQVARRELKWETDYLREAHYAKRFAEVLSPQPEYRVPKIYSHLSTKMVLTMERLSGFPLNHVLDYPQKTRDWIATKLMHLSLREVFEFKFMQTDPNWTNFLYDPVDHKLGVLDFGATREFSDDFLENYLRVLQAGAAQDRPQCLEYSRRLGYLTGDEHRSMVEAHLDSIITLAEPFRTPGGYDFSDQTITARVRALIPVMLQMRLTPPPEPTYSLHRKLSGAFLLCARLRARVPCQEIFTSVTQAYRRSDPPNPNPTTL